MSLTRYPPNMLRRFIFILLLHSRGGSALQYGAFPSPSQVAFSHEGPTIVGQLFPRIVIFCQKRFPRPLCFALNFARQISPQKVHFLSSFRLCKLLQPHCCRPLWQSILICHICLRQTANIVRLILKDGTKYTSDNKKYFLPFHPI